MAPAFPAITLLSSTKNIDYLCNCYELLFTAFCCNIAKCSTSISAYVSIIYVSLHCLNNSFNGSSFLRYSFIVVIYKTLLVDIAVCLLSIIIIIITIHCDTQKCSTTIFAYNNIIYVSVHCLNNGFNCSCSLCRYFIIYKITVCILF